MTSPILENKILGKIWKLREEHYKTRTKLKKKYDRGFSWLDLEEMAADYYVSVIVAALIVLLTRKDLLQTELFFRNLNCEW